MTKKIERKRGRKKCFSEEENKLRKKLRRKIYAKKYYSKEANRKNRNKHQRDRIKSDINFRLRRNLSRRINHILKGTTKSETTLKLLGCSLSYFRTYIESKFELNMSWENYGLWQLDHILPCSSFSLLNQEEQEKCFHYTNLQLLWATTKIARENGNLLSIGNREKSDKIIHNPESQESLEILEYHPKLDSDSAQ